MISFYNDSKLIKEIDDIKNKLLLIMDKLEVFDQHGMISGGNSFGTETIPRMIRGLYLKKKAHKCKIKKNK